MNYSLGGMHVLATNGIHKFSTTHQTNPELGNHDRRTHVLDLCSRIAIKHAKSVSPTIGQTLVEDDAYQAKLAKEYD